MQERRLQTQEVADLHEQGGLTLSHWQEVVERIGEPKNKTEQKLIYYAQKVISGDFPDSGSYHREYLGRRHWQRLSFINTKDKIKTPRKVPPWPKISYIVNPIVEEIKSYAEAETKAVYSLDDYFNSEPFGKYMFDRLNRIWCSLYSYEEVVPATPGGYLPATSSDWSRYDEHTETFTGSLKLIDENPILNLFLLTKDEVQDPLHTPPQELEQILRSISAEILNGRLRAYLNKQAEQYQLVGGWEKEI